MCAPTIDSTEGDGTKLCVSLCVAFDPKVTDGARHSFSSRKPFTQEALLTGFVLMSRSTKRRSPYHSLILTWLGQISPLFSPSRLSISYIKHNNISPVFAHIMTLALALKSHVLLLIPVPPLTHFSCHTPQQCSCFLSIERVLTDVEVAV